MTDLTAEEEELLAADLLGGQEKLRVRLAKREVDRAERREAAKKFDHVFHERTNLSGASIVGLGQAESSQ